jgi:hypothetical protein
MVEETLQGGRRAINRQSELLAHDSDGEIDVLYAAQDAGHEVAALEGFRVAPVGYLVVRGTIDIIEYWAGQPSPGQTPEIMKVVTIAQIHASSHSIQRTSRYAKASTPAMSELPSLQRTNPVAIG